MTAIGAYIAGFSSFFSIWIYCLFQIIPFYCAYVVGSSLMERDNPSGLMVNLNRAALMALFPFAGFAIVFVSMGMSATDLSQSLFRHMSILNQFGGVAIALVGLFFMGALTVRGGSAIERLIKMGFGFLLGAGLALAYKPCVTPTLTDIYNITLSPESVIIGGIFLFTYSLGVFTAIGGLAIGLTIITVSLTGVMGRNVIVKVCASLLLVISALILTDNMTNYKSFLVGRFAPQIQGVSGVK